MSIHTVCPVLLSICLTYRPFPDDEDDAAKCPLCNHALPEFPSPQLQKLLNQLNCDEKSARSSSRQPRLVVMQAVCHRHTVDDVLIPQARTRGWPFSMEWKDIPGRLEDLKRRLDVAVKRPTESEWFLELSEDWVGGYRKNKSNLIGIFNIDAIERRPG